MVVICASLGISVKSTKQMIRDAALGSVMDGLPTAPERELSPEISKCLSSSPPFAASA